MSRTFNDAEIIKLLSTMVGSIQPVADASIDYAIDDNLKTMVDVINWALGEMSESASNRHSSYDSQRMVGERAYSALLEWKVWLQELEEELA